MTDRMGLSDKVSKLIRSKVRIMAAENFIDENLRPELSDKPGLLCGLGELCPGTLVSSQGLAHIFKCHTETIRRAIDQGYLPPPTQMPGGKYWTAGFLLDHINSRLSEEIENRDKESRRLARLNI
jgi:hypothetical protein